MSCGFNLLFTWDGKVRWWLLSAFMGAPLYLTLTPEYFSIRITLEQSKQNKTSSSKDIDFSKCSGRLQSDRVCQQAAILVKKTEIAAICVELLLETNDWFEGGYQGKTLQWDLYWLLYTSLVCWIEIGRQKGGLVSVVLADVGQPESSWHRFWDSWLHSPHGSNLFSPAHVQLAPVEAMLK